MEEFDKLFEGLAGEMRRQMEDMKKCNNLSERKIHAEVVNLLSQSMCSILDSTSNLAEGMHDCDCMDEDDYDDEDDE